MEFGTLNFLRCQGENLGYVDGEKDHGTEVEALAAFDVETSNVVTESMRTRAEKVYRPDGSSSRLFGGIWSKSQTSSHQKVRTNRNFL